jgi:hypothetical protein
MIEGGTDKRGMLAIGFVAGLAADTNGDAARAVAGVNSAPTIYGGENGLLKVGHAVSPLFARIRSAPK